jgi:predicted RNase H-like nuclease (RuvC/YqgF family)
VSYFQGQYHAAVQAARTLEREVTKLQKDIPKLHSELRTLIEEANNEFCGRITIEMMHPSIADN